MSLLLGAALLLLTVQDEPLPVTATNFIRAETDMYFSRAAKDGGFGKVVHARVMTPIDKQDVIRMNRDTLYSMGVFDLDASPVTVTLPDPGKRFMSMMALSQDHYAIDVVYAPGQFTYGKDRIGTRYLFLVIRTLANPEDPADLKAANELQDGVKAAQANVGTFEVPTWDSESHKKVRDALGVLATTLAGNMGGMFGRREEVDPILHVLGTAMGWGGNPRTAAEYESAIPAANDGKTVHRLTLKDVPVDGFWSISVYNAKGYFEKNERHAYSVNSVTAKRDADGSVTVQFGGDPAAAPNYIAIMPGWNYTVRLYRPRRSILDGTWKCPPVQPIR